MYDLLIRRGLLVDGTGVPGRITDLAVKDGRIAAIGRLSGEQTVSEQYLLDLEREAFLSLCGQAKTQERMQHMLKHGKPLRN